MPRACKVCSHPEREAIDRALAAGESFRNVSRRFATSPAGLFRHKSHVKEAIEELRRAKSFSSLPPQKQKYVEGLAEGKTKTQAALDAGYSEAMARSATSNIETREVRAAFAELMRKHIPPEKIAQRIEEGMDAMETKFFQKDGEVTDQRDVISWPERREYTALAAEYGSYHVPPSRDEGTRGVGDIQVRVQCVGTVNIEAVGESPERGTVREQPVRAVEVHAAHSDIEIDASRAALPESSATSAATPEQSPGSQPGTSPVASTVEYLQGKRQNMPLTRTGAAMAFLRGGGSR